MTQGRNPTQAVRGTETRECEKGDKPCRVEIPPKPFAALKPICNSRFKVSAKPVEIPPKPFAAGRGDVGAGFKPAPTVATIEIPLKPFAEGRTRWFVIRLGSAQDPMGRITGSDLSVRGGSRAEHEGQKSDRESQAARAVARTLGIEIGCPRRGQTGMDHTPVFRQSGIIGSCTLSGGPCYERSDRRCRTRWRACRLINTYISWLRCAPHPL